LERERGAVSLLVEDYGKGLSNHQDRDPDANRWNFGIPVMRERVRQLHATFHLESSIGGVIVRTTLPISQTAR
jgi:signal transduction histidine kinase